MKKTKKSKKMMNVIDQYTSRMIQKLSVCFLVLVFNFLTPLLAQKSITWAHTEGLGVDADKLTKVIPTYSYGDAAATSADYLAAGVDGWIETTVIENTTGRFLGLATSQGDASYTSMEYALDLTNFGAVYVYDGTHVHNINITYQEEDVFRITRSSQTVTLNMNDSLIYTWADPSLTDLIVDTSFDKFYGTLDKLTISDSFQNGTPESPIVYAPKSVTWSEIEGLGIVGDDLEKTANNAWGNSGAVSEEYLPIDADGWVETTVLEVDKARLIGLSASHEDHDIQTMDYGVFLRYTGTLRVYENGSVVFSKTVNYAIGSVIRVERISGIIYYKLDGVSFYISSTSATGTLLADVSMYDQNSTLQNIQISETFSTPLPVLEGYEVSWENLVDATVDTDNRLVKTSSSTGWDAGASSDNVLLSGEDGSIEFVLEDKEDVAFIIGLSETDADELYSSIGYGILLSASGDIKVYENGELKLESLDLAQVGDIVKISREGSSIVYYYNGELFYTSLVSSTSRLKVDATLQTGRFPNVITSFEPRIELVPTIVLPIGNNLGSISLAVDGGDGNYSYLWSTGETTSSINQPVGKYTVTVTDGLGLEVIQVFTLSFAVDWDNLVDIEVNEENRLVKTTSSTGWDAGASSKNELAAGEDGWIEFVLEDKNDIAYMVGFSEVDEGYGYAKINYALLLSQDGNIKVVEDAAAKEEFVDKASIGGVVRITREGTSIVYYYNGELLYTSTTTSTGSLKVDVSSHTGRFPVVMSSFQSKIKLIPTIVSPTLSGGTGTISLEVIDGGGNYSYNWSSGETTSSISQPIGDYTVTVTDGLGQSVTRSYYLGYSVAWDNLVDIEVNEENRLVKTTSSTSWDAGASSKNELAAGEDGWIEFVLEDQNEVIYMVGLSEIDEGYGYAKIDYGLLLNQDANIKVFEDGTEMSVFTDLASVGGVARIAREGSSIVYYYNGELLYTSTSTSTGGLKVDVSSHTGRFPIVMSSFQPMVELIPTIVSPVILGSLGSINLAVDGGDGNYSYSWSSGETTSSISQPIGNYTVTVTYGMGQSVTRSYYLGYSVAWDNLANVEVNEENRLVKTTSLVAWNGGASSKNELAAGEDGWIEFVLEDQNEVIYMVGLSEVDEGYGYAKIDYGLLLNQDANLKVFEDGTEMSVFTDLASVGGVARIAREGSSIVYYYNDELLYTSTTTSTGSLKIDVSSHTGRFPIVMTSVQPRMELMPTIVSPTVAGGNGTISVAINDGDGNYSYLWSTGETTSSINQPAGNYTVTITNEDGFSVTEVYSLGYDLVWESLVDVEVDADNRLVKTTISTEWDAGASSKNGLVAGEDGWVEFVLEDNNDVNYMVGLSEVDEYAGYASIDYAIFIRHSGDVKIYEGGTEKAAFLGLASVGDVGRVAREGTSIVYSYNGEVIYTSTIPSISDLKVDVATSFGRFPIVMSSFQFRMELIPTIISPIVAGGNGTISLTVNGGDGNYSYSWSSGETTSSITQPIDDYTVTVTDGLGRIVTRTYHLGYMLEWENLVDVEVDADNRLVKTTISTEWDAGASSKNGLAAGEAGWIEFVLEDKNDVNYMVGLSEIDEHEGYADIDYAIFIRHNGDVKIYESGTEKAVFLGLASVGDVGRVAREGASIVYYYNGEVVYISTIASTSDLKVDVATSFGRFPIVTSSFQPRMELIPTIISPTVTGGNGTISLTVSEGGGNYNYSWSTGETTTSIRQPVGDYTVTVTDGLGRVVTGTYHLGYMLEWENLVDVEIDGDNRLIKTTTTEVWDAGASSKNSLSTGEEGFIEFVLEDNNEVNYMLGLSEVDEDEDYRSIDYAIFISKAGNVMVYENSVKKVEFIDLADIGDVVKISREDVSIVYYYNGEVIYTSSTPSKSSLKVDVSLNKGRFPIITSSFQPRMELIPTIISPTVAGGNGTINLTVSEGGGDYNYSWSTGETTSSIRQPVGDYTVTVTDGLGRVVNRTYHLGYMLEWEDLVDVEVNADNRLIKTTTTEEWDAGASSKNSLSTGEEGFIEFVLEDNNEVNYMVGLSEIDEDEDYTSIGYAIFISKAGNVMVYENSVKKVEFIDLADIGDVVKISRESASIVYYYKGEVIYTSSTSSTSSLKADVSMSQGRFPVVTSSFQPMMELVPKIVSPTAAGGNGTISLAVSEGDGNYSYSWSSGETTSSISQPVGDYTVTATDGFGRTVTRTYHLGYNLVWENLVNVEVDEDNRLVETTNSIDWDTGASSNSTLEVGEDGWIEFVVEERNDVHYMIGLSSTDDDASYRTIDYAVFVKGNGDINVYESSSAKSIHFDITRTGDVVRVAREGSSIVYYYNGEVLYTSTNTSTGILKADVSIAKGPLPQVRTTFGEEPEASLYTAIKSGDWHDSSTWASGSIPESGDQVIIDGYSITVNADVECSTIRIEDAVTPSELQILSSANLTVYGKVEVMKAVDGSISGKVYIEDGARLKCL